MTRDQIAEDLMTLVVRIGNELPLQEGGIGSAVPADVRAAEWAYVKGLAAYAILTFRERVLPVAPATSRSAVLEQPGGPSRRTDLEAR